MKNLLNTIIAISLSFFIASCEKKENESKDVAEKVEVKNTTKEVVPAEVKEEVAPAEQVTNEAAATDSTTPKEESSTEKTN